MAWTAVKEVCKEEEYTGTPTAREESQEFIVKSDTDVRPYAVRLATHGGTTIPLVGDSHPTDTSSKCIKVSITRLHEGAGSPEEYGYRVKCDYSTATNVSVLTTSPLIRPWEYSTNSEGSVEDYFMDRASTPKPVVNSAGETFDTLPQRLKKGIEITITRNQASFSAATLQTYDKTVNSGSVTIDGYSVPAGMLLMTGIDGPKVVENGTTYYRVTYKMALNADGWHDYPLDVGYTELVSGVPKKIIDAESREVSKPWPLDGAGAKAALVTDPPAILDFEPYEEVSWAGLSFV